MTKIENMVYKQRWFMEVVKENTQRVGVTEEDGRDRVRWSQMICCCDPQREQQTEEEEQEMPTKGHNSPGPRCMQLISWLKLRSAYAFFSSRLSSCARMQSSFINLNQPEIFRDTHKLVFTWCRNSPFYHLHKKLLIAPQVFTQGKWGNVKEEA